MKSKRYASRLPGLTCNGDCDVQSAFLPGNLNVHLYPIVTLAASVFFLTGCTTQHTSISNLSSPSVLAEPQASRFGRIGLAEDFSPATFSFQKAKGKLGSAKEAIVNSAEFGLSAPGAGVIVTKTMLSGDVGCDGDPRFYLAVAGVAGGVTAVGAALVGPLVGAQGLVRSLRSVSPAELAEREVALTNALTQMAAQQPFREALLQAGSLRILGGFLPSGTKNPSDNIVTNAADAVFEARVDDLRLERSGSGEGSYWLRIKTHARLVRVADGAVCFEQSAEYRSGTALFLDWTLQGGIEGVAETGYRALARYYTDQLLFGSPTVATAKTIDTDSIR
jgi:hypothetical protein